ncbi:TAXI family TRAP transporter solute-binding subunit [bacterium]|nr:TAXI family TRAP transporter solute-binding subunit [bacterium]
MKRNRLYLFIVFIAVFGLIFSTSGVQAKKMQLLLGGGGTAGSWYVGSAVISDIINKTYKDLNITPIPGGGVSNVKSLAKGRIDFGYTYHSMVFEAAKRNKPFTDNLRFEDIRAVTSLMPLPLHVVVKDSSAIRSLPDVVGKRVCAGYMGSGYETAFRQMLAVYGLTPKDIEAKGGKYIYATQNDALRMMKDGLLDVMVALAGTPASYFLELSTAYKIRLLSFSDDIINKFFQQHPGWDVIDIPAKLYNTKGPAHVIASWSGVFSFKDIPEDVVYRFTKGVFEQRNKLIKAHGAYANYTKENALAGLSRPLHPGAEKYWKEIGVIK